MRAGSPTAQLVESASTMASARSFSPCRSRIVARLSEPISSSPSTKTVTPTGSSSRRGRAGPRRGPSPRPCRRRCHGRRPGRPARSARTTGLSQPSGVAGRLDVVVGVEQHRRRTLPGPSTCPMTAGRPPSRTISTARPSARSSSATAEALASTWAWSNASRQTRSGCGSASRGRPGCRAAGPATRSCMAGVRSAGRTSVTRPSVPTAARRRRPARARHPDRAPTVGACSDAARPPTTSSTTSSTRSETGPRTGPRPSARTRRRPASSRAVVVADRKQAKQIDKAKRNEQLAKTRQRC